jgi:pimeloyl-ACP methyl ester carboxylesterase
MPGEGTDGIVATSAERAVIPAELIERIAMWVGDADAPALAQRPGTAPAAALDWGGTRLREQVEAIGPHGLRAIVTEPADGADDPATLVFLNSGSEPHYGPGRAWVAFARDLAARGRRTVRADFRGWGESPGDDPAATPSPYAESCVDDARSVARALAGDGRQAVLFGLCSSAYVALQVAAVEPLAGCVALNPQLYWRPGQPIDLTPAENHLFRQPIQRKEERWQRLHVWSALDLLGARTHAGRWLDVLRRRRAPVTLVFSKGDDGMHYLRVRLGRRFGRYLGSGAALVEIDGVDHALHRSWLRGSIVDVLDDALARAEPVTP